MGLIAGAWRGLVDSLQGLLLGGTLLFIPFLPFGAWVRGCEAVGLDWSLERFLFVLRAFLYGALAGGALALGPLLVGRYFFYRPRTITTE